MVCPICKGERWVCENHDGLPWIEQGCKCGAAAPCVCNPNGDPPPGFKVLVSRWTPKDGYIQ